MAWPKLPLPLEPQWIIDAAGLVEFAPAEVHQGPFPVSGGKLKLYSIRPNPQRSDDAGFV